MDDKESKTPVRLLKKYLEFLGRPITGNWKPRFALIFLLHLVTFVQIIIRQIMPWNNIENRFASLEDLNVFYFLLILTYELGFSKEKVEKLLKLFQGFRFCDLPLSDRHIQIRKEQYEREKEVFLRFVYIDFLYAVINSFTPSLYGLYLINFTDIEQLAEEDVITPYKCWVPFTVKKNINFIATVVPQIFCRFLSAIFYTIWFVLILGTMYDISVEMRMLITYVEELDDRLGDNPDESKINEYTKKLVAYHVTIIGLVKEYNKISQVVLFALNQVWMFEFCIAVYCIIEVDEIAMQIRYSAVFVILVIIMITFASNGQLLIDEADNFITALERISWIEKPSSFKKSLHLMLISAQRPLLINPVGLFVINKRNLMVVINAAYSYVNVMRSYKTLK